MHAWEQPPGRMINLESWGRALVARISVDVTRLGLDRGGRDDPNASPSRNHDANTVDIVDNGEDACIFCTPSFGPCRWNAV